MLKKGLLYTLMALTLAFINMNAYAMAPMIQDPGDVVVGDAGGQGQSPMDDPIDNNFVFPAAIDILSIVSDDNTSNTLLKYSYDTLGNYTVNGVPPLGAGDPNDPSATGNDLVINDATAADLPNSLAEDGDPYTLTFRNVALSPPGGAPFADPAPGFTGILTSQTAALTLFASDCTTFSSRTITVYTASDSSDTISGGGLELVIEIDFENGGPQGWLGAVQLGGIATSTVGGLCMDMPGPGDNALAWLSPQPLVELVDMAVYKATCSMSTNQTGVDQIPLWELLYQNTFFVDDGINPPFVAGNTFGGEAVILDVDGGANGIGRPQGLDDFVFWFAPNALITPQWRGMTGVPSIDANSAFDSSVDAYNDINILFRVLDFDAANINAQVDMGEICVQRLRIERTDYNTIQLNPLYTPMITDAIYAAEATGQAGCGSSSIDNGAGEILYTVGAGTCRKTMVPFDPMQDNGVNFNLQLYPVQWQSNKLYLGLSRVRSNVNGGVGTTEGVDPIDTFAIVATVPAGENAMVNLTVKGSAGNMEHAASPKLPGNTGGVGQTYVGVWASNNASVSMGNMDADRFRFYTDIFNVPTIAGDGMDPVAIETMETYEAVNF
jgi:hypothetical protein